MLRAAESHGWMSWARGQVAGVRCRGPGAPFPENWTRFPPARPLRSFPCGQAPAADSTTRAAERLDRRLEFHRKLPTGGRHKMIDALLHDGIIAETLADYRLGDGATLIEDAATGLMLTTLRLTDVGLAAVGLEAPTQPDTAPQAVLSAWDDEANREADIIPALEGPMASLRTLLAGRAPRASTGALRTARNGTKQEAVLALLRRDEGASGPQIAEATGWAAHTVRGFLAGLKKKGFGVETLDRVRMVGSNKAGAKGALTVYRIAG